MDQIDLQKIGQFVKQGAIETLETMVGFSDVSATDPKVSDDSPPEAEMTAYVGLAAGFIGGVAVHCDMVLGRTIAAQMLCVEDPSQLSDSDIRDAFGEVANMIAGGMKTRMEAEGTTYEISVPEVAVAPENIAVNQRRVGQMVSIDLKAGSGILHVSFSIAREAGQSVH